MSENDSDEVKQLLQRLLIVQLGALGVKQLEIGRIVGISNNEVNLVMKPIVKALRKKNSQLKEIK
jgi:hypothetical protein